MPRLLTLAARIICLLTGASLMAGENVARGTEFPDCPTIFAWGDEGNEPVDRMAEPLATDRPDFTEASSVVGRGIAQIEMGYTYSYDSDAVSATESHTYPETLLRVGAGAEWLEFRFVWSAVQETASNFGVDRTTAVGANDMSIGVKIGLTQQSGVLPEAALILDSTVPTGSSEFTNDEMLPRASLLYGWDVNDWYAIGAQTYLARALDEVTGQPYLEVVQSVTGVISWTDKTNTYTEWFVFMPDGADTNHNEHYFDGGLTYLVTDNFQLDVRAGVGLNGAAEDYFAGTGLAVRF